MPWRHTSFVAVGLALCLTISDAAAEEAALRRARADYMLHCQGCHLPDGTGAPGRVPNLRDRVGLFLSVEGGRKFLVQVPGVASAAVDDARLAELLNWMLAEFGGQSVPADAARYEATEVAALRRAPLTEVVAVRAELIDRIKRRRRLGHLPED